MSWSTRSWRPATRRDGPLVILAAFFLAPAFFFLVGWYADYIMGVTSAVVVPITAAATLLLPALFCYRLAGRAGRRRALWAILVLAGSLLSLWLPIRYLVLGGPLPPAAYGVLPVAFRQTIAATLVSLIPLLMGMIPVVVYGLAIGIDRPLAGIPPRASVLVAALAGILVWAATLFISLLNPVRPPLIPVGAETAITARVSPPPTLPGEIVPLTWASLLWRLHDGVPPGATHITAGDGDLELMLTLPVVAQSQVILGILVGPGMVELVNSGDDPPGAGSEVSTTLRPLPGAEEAFETVLSSGDLMTEAHWSGTAVGAVSLETENDAPVMTLTLSDEGHRRLERFSEDNQGAFLSLVLDNVVLLSFPTRGSIEDGTLVVRRLDPEIAPAVTAILRYGPLPLVPEIEMDR